MYKNVMVPSPQPAAETQLDLVIDNSGKRVSSIAMLWRSCQETRATWSALATVASLNYGWYVSGAVQGLIAEALGTAVLPSFARIVAIGRWADLRRVQRNYVGLALCVGVGVVVMLTVMLFSHPIISLLYQRGAFSSANTQVVAQIQVAFAIQLPAYITAIIVTRQLAALQCSWIRTIGGLGNLFLKDRAKRSADAPIWNRRDRFIYIFRMYYVDSIPQCHGSASIKSSRGKSG